jgi:hypothetical protein
MAVAAAAVVALSALPAAAQTPMPTTADAQADKPKTREQVKLERDEFLRSHYWSVDEDNWVLRPEFEAPFGVKTREQVKAERNRFLSTHRWDTGEDQWVSVGPEPRDISTLTRDQVRAETREFLRTHDWDMVEEVWVDKRSGTKRR